MKIFPARSSSLALLFCAVAILAARDAVAYVPVYGGLEYVSSADMGYIASKSIPIRTPVNSSGTAVGATTLHNSGASTQARAERWDPSGALELGHLSIGESGTTSGVNDINEGGTTVGYDYPFTPNTASSKRAVRWEDSSTNPTELGSLEPTSSGYSSSEAYAVNSGGTTVGIAAKYVLDTFKGQRAVRWDGSSTIAAELDNLGTDNDGYTFASANDVNDSGTAVGYATKYISGVSHGAVAVRWDGGGTSATELSHLGVNSLGSSSAYATAINDDGVTIGYSTKFVSGSDKGERAARWDASGTSVTELDILETDSSGRTRSFAEAINNSGTIVGYSLTYDSGVIKGWRALRWDGPGTDVTELGNLGTDSSGYTKCYAWDVNEAGIAAGYAQSYDSGHFTSNHAVVWRDDGVAFDLNTLVAPGSGWTLQEAYNISDTGWVAGIGLFDPAGPEAAYARHFLLQLPEALPGDYNGNDVIDAADYSAWRDAVTAGASTLLNDPTPGSVDETDFEYWRVHFGETLGGGAGATGSDGVAAAVPEPSGWLLMLFGVVALQRWATIRFLAPA